MNAYYQQQCLTGPVVPSVIMGGVFSAIRVAEGFPLSPALLMTNMGGIYLYNALQCPMVAIHGRESCMHNGISAGILGYIGVKHHKLGVPFVGSNFFYANPQFSPAITGAVVYGAIGATLGILANKPW